MASPLLLLFILLAAVAFPATAQHQAQAQHKAAIPSHLPPGYSLIRDGAGWVYVDQNNRPVLRPYIFDNGPDYFEEGLARFVENGKIGFFDQALNIVIPAQYEFAFPFSHGVAEAGTHCIRSVQGEHTSTTCEKWEFVRRPDQ